MPSKFGGIPVDSAPPSGSKFGGVAVDAGSSSASQSTSPPEQSFGAALREYGSKMNPINWFKDAAAATASPEATGAAVNSYGAQTQKMLQESLDAFHKGDYAGAARHAVFGYLLNGIPGLGSSLDEAGNKMQSGDYAGGLADTAALATQVVAGAKAPAIAGTLRDAGAEALDTVRPTPKPTEAPAEAPPASSTAGKLRTAAGKFALKQAKKIPGVQMTIDAIDSLKDAGVIGDQAPPPAPPAAPPAAAAPAPAPTAAVPKRSPVRPPLAEPTPTPPDIPIPNAGGGGPLRAPLKREPPPMPKPDAQAGATPYQRMTAPPPPSPTAADEEFLNQYNRAVRYNPPPPEPELSPDEPLLKEGPPPPTPLNNESAPTAKLKPEPPSPAQAAEAQPPAATPAAQEAGRQTIQGQPPPPKSRGRKASAPPPPANMSKSEWTQYQADLKSSGFKTDPGAYPGAKPGAPITQSFLKNFRGQVAPKSVRTFPAEQLEDFANAEGMSMENAYEALKANGWLVKYPQEVPEGLPAMPPPAAARPVVRSAGERGSFSNREVGPHGPIFGELRGNATAAVAKLVDTQDGEVPGALQHPDVGDIDLIWGQPGETPGEGYGLSKIVKWHPEVVDDLQGILSGMKEQSRNLNTIQLDGPNHHAVVRRNWKGDPKTWLLTQFEKKGE